MSQLYFIFLRAIQPRSSTSNGVVDKEMIKGIEKPPQRRSSVPVSSSGGGSNNKSRKTSVPPKLHSVPPKQTEVEESELEDCGRLI